MALNIPMPDLPGKSLLQGLDTGSSMFSRLIQPTIDRERMKQQQDQFLQNLELQKQTQGRANALMPYMIQQYQDAHNAAANEAQMKAIYQNLIKQALNPDNTGAPTIGAPQPSQGFTPQMPSEQPNPQLGGSPIPVGAVPEAGTGLPGGGQGPTAQPTTPMTAPIGQEQVLRPGNPNLSKLDAVAGLVPGIPKPVTHFSNGMLYTTYPSGRMTAQAVNLPGAKTQGEKNVSAKEASKIRDQATALINSANLVQQGYDLLDNNTDLTGIGSGLASKFNLSNNADLGKFVTATGKLQAELGKYASSRGGIQAVNWAASVKPSQWKPEDYNYGMFEGIQRNIQDDYKTLNDQYRAATGEDLPLRLPEMANKRGVGGKQGKQGGEGKVTKWKMVSGQLVKE